MPASNATFGCALLFFLTGSSLSLSHLLHSPSLAWPCPTPFQTLLLFLRSNLPPLADNISNTSLPNPTLVPTLPRLTTPLVPRILLLVPAQVAVRRQAHRTSFSFYRFLIVPHLLLTKKNTANPPTLPLVIHQHLLDAPILRTPFHQIKRSTIAQKLRRAPFMPM